MARNSVTQNPSNKVGRHSGAGEAGISEIVPTEREAARGLEPIRISSSGGWSGSFALGVGAFVLIGAGLAALLAQRARRPKGLRPRIERMVGLR